jgi:hypothetical protein
MAKSSGRHAGRKEALLLSMPGRPKLPRTLTERSLRSLLPLPSSACLDARRIERQRGVHIHKMIYIFCLYKEKARRSLRTLRLIFFLPRVRRDFYNFLNHKKCGIKPGARACYNASPPHMTKVADSTNQGDAHGIQMHPV